MFSFFSKKKQNEQDFYFPITTDIHSHILPGIDDGSPDVATSLELIKGLMALGVKKSVATPHIISDLYRNTPETISAALQQLQQALQQAHIDYEVTAAAEYMLDEGFLSLLNAATPLLCIKEKIILTEFSYSIIPENPKEISFKILTNGYTPILAHPERYAYFHSNYKSYHLIQDLGFLLQVNLLSLTGYYGPAVTKAARYIIRNRLATFTATDLHHHNHLAALHDAASKGVFKELAEFIPANA
ncbi:MAG: CpsB/CapC family capsule biosynthesis tyrosine phosphatase [Ferruginibacter sp.]